MLAPIDFSQIEVALRSPAGHFELAIIVVSLGVAFAVDRRVHLATDGQTAVVHFGLGSINRLLFPATALLLLLIVRAATKAWFTPFFFDIAIPLLAALALIRICLYVLRNLFGGSRNLRASERAASFVIWFTVFLYFLGLLPQIAAGLADIQLDVGKHRLNLLEILKSALVVLLTLVVTLWLSALIERRLLRSQALDLSMRAVFSKMVRALLLLVGILVAMSSIGIDLTVLSVFGGAIGVGIGLGLQKLASNYIAGFTILLDRSIRLGDIVMVDNRTGIVDQVTSRYVVVRGLDNVASVVPNELLITQTFVNYTRSSTMVRVPVPLQVAYGGDLEATIALLEGIALEHPRVLKTKPPTTLVLRFADSGIDLELGVWIDDPENGQGNVRSDLYRAIWIAFRARGIEIPFPQREIRLLGEAKIAASPLTSAEAPQG